MAQAASSELGQSASKHFPTATSTDENAISAYFTGDGENQDQDNDEADFPDEDEESEELGEDELFLEDREYDEEEAIFLQACHSAYADVRKDLRDRRRERGFARSPSSARGRSSGDHPERAPDGDDPQDPPEKGTPRSSAGLTKTSKAGLVASTVTS